MRRTNRAAVVAVLVLLGGVSFGAAGCDQEMAGAIVTSTGTFAGDLVTILTTGYLQQAVGLEAAHTDEEHSHASAPLHDHEH